VSSCFASFRLSPSRLSDFAAGFAEFAEALTRARARAEMREVLLIVQHAKSDWRAAAWMLERRRPERYGRRQRVEHITPDGPLRVNLTLLTDAELTSLRAVLEKLSQEESESFQQIIVKALDL